MPWVWAQVSFSPTTPHSRDEWAMSRDPYAHQPMAMGATSASAARAARRGRFQGRPATRKGRATKATASPLGVQASTPVRATPAKA